MAVPSSGVTIDINHNPDGDRPYTYGGNGNKDVQLVRTEDPPDSGFYRFKHTKNGSNGNAFHVEKVMSGGIQVPDLNQSENILYLAVWYYSGDKNHNQPLLIEIGDKHGTYKHYTTKESGSWTVIDKERPSPLEGEPLEQKLEYLNCEYHKTVSINLSHKNSETHKNGRYCCDKHNGDNREGKVTVTPGSVKGDSHIEYYKHDVNHNLIVSGIYYKDTQDKRKRIRITDLKNSVDGSVKFYTFYSNNGSKEPRLIYLDSTGQPNAKGWYQPNTTGDDNQPWTKFQDIPKEITPDNIGKGKNIKEEDSNKYLETLECKIYGTGGKCNEYRSSSSQLNVGGSGPSGPDGGPKGDESLSNPGPSGLQGPAGGGANAASGSEDDGVQGPGASTSPSGGGSNDPDGSASEAEPSPAGSYGKLEAKKEPDTHYVDSRKSNVSSTRVTTNHSQGIVPHSPLPTSLEPLVEPNSPTNAEAAAQIMKASVPTQGTPIGSPLSPPNSNSNTPTTPKIVVSVTTGILGTSALVCLAGFKLYNRYKGDPWVRQI
ncbi:hypothetical protein BEWA_028080 [Theileria equi strain WA]|uniref:Uncharacterized protein n=1 Tax=Theileria equi strain WA TaxID=1537102 RepID=L0AYK4_THEEQ|nr:hypothetical protein BEWA_028080 [Theileria equi strain WA]AFZ79959.1 hypothetical protein BEWA_028080 [Theileria equi strain WA]|eukprot:XP_004829625.1 hypothetical protein BEWA_028080 [Theileria equi strain WA]